jgi:hypothetical protein
VKITFPLVQAADPAAPEVIVPVLAKDMMHLIYEAERKPTVCHITCSTINFEKVAYRECICPEITSGRFPNR